MPQELRGALHGREEGRDKQRAERFTPQRAAAVLSIGVRSLAVK